MNFNITFGNLTGLTASQQAVFEAACVTACQYYQHEFTNNVTVNVTFNWSALPAGDLANNNFAGVLVSYAQLTTALKAIGRSPDQIGAYATMPASDPTGSSQWFVPQAQARLLGLTSATGTDDTVNLNSNIGFSGFSFNPYARNTPGTFDAIGVLEHELSEGSLGRIQALGMTGAGNEQNWNGWHSELDLFRYNPNGGSLVRALTPGPGYFSIDGQTLLQQYNNPVNGGDAVDWLPSIQGDSYGDGYRGTGSFITPVDVREDNILGWTRASASSDFTGNYTSDVFWQNTTSGDVGEWLMSNGQISAAPALGNATGYQIVGTGDFNGDGTSDIFWQQSNGNMGEWIFSRGQISAAPFLGTMPAGYKIAAIGDFNGDGTSDIFWESGSGTIGEWLISNAEIYAAPSLGQASTSLQIIGAGRFTGGKTDDILWEQSNGVVGEWLISNGQIYAAPSLGSTAPGFQILGYGDFTGNGTDDILWRDSTSNTVGEWIMSNGNIAQSITLGSTSPTWQFVGVGDFTSSGVQDIIWRDSSTGAMSEWVMQGGQINQSIGLGASSPNLNLVLKK
ncbi:VCBS repeat-containing protein [Bradyrhizobium sp. U87765 SZCCT0131]|uniref:NF038122 family metalloprotease n=1 Tax=unclassified Bradyrhizobium TaxID=2631580 RepID=UPI001BAC4792|nr:MULTISPECIES: NF038122 family metalloprotease [unclassified Bradyrhizobium]MBR1220160.1 VCBS repeat-containing protein [Bradyrhizobium sp. U87765 SZCCT0131]MBR1263384.1 VCBS repeat-containing protein [Bradyrhizobium sp. U87765 SZCCT0134]MBR1306733.1 VCBS repeat-containing protein [Bradyrhizobium sp. U87765 SZCCT0110]MBR1323232.1 VCBS repeat-containing protein [Bradyrhizobium sp. U87765 SZCCT0109]MBR1345687.1 VCBS repeat-containing protein [Bradyrhizobium sp. U87765 SZCCT0048]